MFDALNEKVVFQPSMILSYVLTIVNERKGCF